VEPSSPARAAVSAGAPYLIDRKRRRQILMVSHNANLVIGADSEQVIVANRHGVDRRKPDDRLFDYLSGSLERSFPKREAELVLEECSTPRCWPRGNG